MKYALLVATAVLFAGPVMAHPTTCVLPGTMVMQTTDGNLVLVNKVTGEEKPFFATPDCHPLLNRNGLAHGGTGVVQTKLDDGSTLTKLPPVTTTPVVTLPLTDTPVVTTQKAGHLLTTPVVPTKMVPVTPVTQVTDGSVTNNYYGNIYYGSSWWSGWWDWSNADDSYYTPPFTLEDLRVRCAGTGLDMEWAARALPYYATNYSFFPQLVRIEDNWNRQHDYEEACQIFMVPDKPIPIQ